MLATLDHLGERRAIEIVQSCLDVMPGISIPFGDDVSAFSIGKDNLAVLKTDMLVGKTDVPKGMNLWHAARKAVVMNISDFAAKGVKPLSLVVSLGLPENFTERDLREIGKGLNAGARQYDAYVIGGDTGEASDLIIDVSIFGLAKKGDIIRRSGAREGDLVGVTGLFGKTAAGLSILLHASETSRRRAKVLVDSVLMPCARLKEGLALSAAKAVSASIDSSDGLAWSLHEIAKASGVGFLIDDLPIDKEAKKFAETNRLNPTDLALYGGEEYEIVLTAKPEFKKVAEEAVERTGGKLRWIGKAASEKKVLLHTNGTELLIEPRGYEHFRTDQS